MLGHPPVTYLLAVSEHHLNAEEPHSCMNCDCRGSACATNVFDSEVIPIVHSAAELSSKGFVLEHATSISFEFLLICSCLSSGFLHFLLFSDGTPS